MVADNPPRFDGDRGLDEDSGKMKCWCSGEGIKTFVPAITPNVLIPSAPEGSNNQPDLYHCAVLFYGWMLSDDDPDLHEAFRGDFLVRLQKFKENGGPASDWNEYYVGFPADFQVARDSFGSPAITKTLVNDKNRIPQGLVKVASQELGHCPRCPE